MIEALSSICPPEKQAVEAAPKLARARLPDQPHSDSHGLWVKAPGGSSAGNRRANRSRCSFCRAELGESFDVTIPGSGRPGRRASTGCFCSSRCRNCVLALAALHPSPLASEDFLSTRTLLTDRLLDLWRRGLGPDPELVLQAAKRASCGLPTSAPAVLTGAHAGAEALPLAKSPAIPLIKPSNMALFSSVLHR
jgi:hypothetical protein